MYILTRSSFEALRGVNIRLEPLWLFEAQYSTLKVHLYITIQVMDL